MAPKSRRGLRRLLKDEPDEEPAPASSSSTGGQRRGGLRQRLAESVPGDGGGDPPRQDEAVETALFVAHRWEDTEDAAPRGGLRQRLQSAESSGSAGSAASLSFNELMKRDWGKGLRSSVKVQEYAAGAASQNAEGIGNWAAGARRTLKERYLFWGVVQKERQRRRGLRSPCKADEAYILFSSLIIGSSRSTRRTARRGVRTYAALSMLL